MTLTLMKTTKNCLLLQLTLKVEDRTLAGHVHQRAKKTGKCLRCLRAHTHSLIFMWKYSRSDSQMIYDALNASAAYVPPVLMSSSPGRLSCSRLSWGHIEKRVAHTPPKGQDIPVWHVCLDAVHIRPERDCEGGKDALPLFAHLPGCHLGYCSVLLDSWHTSTAIALAYDLSGESAGCWNVFKHLVRAGKCHLSIMMTRPPPIDDRADHIHLTGLKTVITHQTYRHRKKSRSFVWNMMSHKELNFTRVSSGWNGG